MRILALVILAAAGAGLAGCGTIDQVLFGGGNEEAAQPPATANAATPPAQQAAQQQGALPPAEQQVAQPPPPPAPVAAPPPPPVATVPLAPPPAAGEFTPVAVQPGSDTGTAVSHTVASLRSQLEALESKLAANAQHFADLRNSGAQDAAGYQSGTGEISARLSAGTTRGNPELIGEWNNAQNALDSLTGNINTLGQLASDVSKDASDAHQEFATIQSTFDVSGAVDEDHRQLSVLSDETGQTVVLFDRLLKEVKQTLERETAYVAAERGHLTTLAELIKAGNYAPFVASRGETGSAHAATRTRAASATSSQIAAAIESGGPIITIKFDRANVTYDRALYSALSAALAAKPGANFNVVGVSPGSANAPQSGADQDAEAVMRSMGEMGVPATRMSATSSSDPAIAAAEVRVYVK